MQDPLVYLNGAMTPLSEAKIPVLDRGFIFGDGIYEVIPIYAGKPFRARQHLARLFRSLKAIGIPNPHSEEEWMALVNKLAQANPADSQLVYIQVTRGVAKRTHAFPAEVTPTVFMMCNAFAPPGPQAIENGVACVTLEDKRWLHCDIKSTSLLGNVLAAQHAVDHQAMEAIQFRDGLLTEGSSSNVWVVENGTLMAPPKSERILEGIRYGFVEELCAAKGIPFQAREIPREEVFAADELMISSASKEIAPVVSLDGQRIGEGRPGPIFRQLYAAYQEAKKA